MELGFYYLHTNGSLIWKRFEPDYSDFVIKVWDMAFHAKTRETFIKFLSSAKSLGASEESINKIAITNKIDFKEIK